jgi:transketolase
MPNVYVVRPADAIETREAWKLAIDPKSGAPWALVLTRQKVPFLGVREAPVEKGAYVIADSDGAPDLLLLATGSEVALAIDAKNILDGKGVPTRVVSMPCFRLFDRQPQTYKDEVLPPQCTARMSIEAGATFGWSQYIGERGYAFGIDHFGQSAPAAEIAKAFGFTADNIAAVALEKFALATR